MTKQQQAGSLEAVNLARIENKLLVWSETTGASVYDFDFDLYFECAHPYRIEREECCVLRVGPIANYVAEYEKHLQLGLRLINSPAEHARTSDIEHWYPLLSEWTPRTRVYRELPAAKEIEADFGWPVFIKGARQTSQHNPDLSVVTSPAQYEKVRQEYRQDSILHWQRPAVREYIPLLPVEGQVPGKVPVSAEYRSFWWNGDCVGWGRYWYQIAPYKHPDVGIGLALAEEAARRLEVPFLVVDIAKCQDGRWVVIECNDAQESGYTGVMPRTLWQQILTRI